MNRKAAQVRRAVILAAGESRRLDVLKLGKPKPMIEVAGKPLLAWHFERCREAGVEEVFINLHHLPQQIINFVGDGSAWNLKVIFNYEPLLCGTAGAVGNFRSHLQAEPFLVIYSDNFFTFPLASILEAHFSADPRPNMSMVLFEQEDVSRSGVAVCDSNHWLRSFIEKPGAGVTQSHWANSGLYLLEPEMLDVIPRGFSDFGHEIIPHALAKGMRILGVKSTGRVYSVDTPELLRSLEGQIELL